MKRSILKKIKSNGRKFALCLAMVGLSTFSFGFSAQDSNVKSDEVKTIEQSFVKVNGFESVQAINEASEFVNVTSREAVNKAPEEVTFQPISAVEDVENLVNDDEIETVNLNYGTEEEFNYTAVMSMEATAYLPSDGGGSGMTAMGIPATYGVVAVDPSIIPLGTRLYIPGYGMAIAADTGGAIVGYCIDLCMESYAEAMDFGRRVVTVYVLD
ncbi:MAG: 3D domain-containing protein [Selenomonadaceae bacterium]|nr:3D domain-containing protein [Selenomonadaceae bacterium]